MLLIAWHWTSCLQIFRDKFIIICAAEVLIVCWYIMYRAKPTLSTTPRQAARNSNLRSYDRGQSLPPKLQPISSSGAVFCQLLSLVSDQAQPAYTQNISRCLAKIMRNNPCWSIYLSGTGRKYPTTCAQCKSCFNLASQLPIVLKLKSRTDKMFAWKILIAVTRVFKVQGLSKYQAGMAAEYVEKRVD